MAQTGYTPISLYYSATASTAPTAGNLVAGELALNTNDGKLYYKDSSGVVQLLASKAGSGGSFGALSATSITNSGLTSGRVVYSTTGGLETDSVNLTFNGTTLTANTIGAFTLGGTIAGGGNQINNVIIGTSTPLAGSFTTLTGSTSVTTPILKSASSLTLQTNGTTTAVTIDTSQNVGIGVVPSAWVTYKAIQNQNASLYSYANNAYLGANIYQGASNPVYISTGYASQLTQANGQFQFLTAPSGTAGNAISFTQAMTLDASGNLNITSPANTDSIATINSTSTNVSQRLNFTANGTLQTQIYDDSAETRISAVTSKPLTFRTANTERARITSAGDLSVASANAGARSLYVYNSDAGAGSYAQSYVQSNNGLFNITVGSTANGGIASLYSTSTGGAYLYTVGAYSLRFGTNSSEAMRIDSSGNVLINTTTGYGKFNVQNSAGTGKVLLDN
jgi:hypothetical protein